MKKIIGMLMALVMLVSLCTPAMAEVKASATLSNAQAVLDDNNVDVPIGNIIDATNGVFSPSVLKNCVPGPVAFITDNSDSMRILLAEDCENGDALFTLIVDGTTVATEYVDRTACMITRTDFLDNSVSHREYTPASPVSTQASYTYLGNIRYQYMAGNTYKLCGAKINLSTTVDYEDLYDVNQEVRDEVSLAAWVLSSFSLITAGMGAAIASLVLSVAGVVIDTTGRMVIKANNLRATRTSNTWKVVDMNNSSNYEIFSGDKYVITADGKHSGEVYNVEEFFDRSDFTGRNNSFAYYVYPQLFSYVIFSIYDWSNA